MEDIYQVGMETQTTFFVYINSTSLSMMNITTNNSWIRLVFHFNTRDAITVNVAFLEITLNQLYMYIRQTTN